MITRRIVSLAAITLAANTVLAQSLPTLQSVTTHITPATLFVDYAYDANVSNAIARASVVYQPYSASNQPIGQPSQPVPPDAASQGNHLFFSVPMAALENATDVTYRLQSSDQAVLGITPTMRVSVDLAARLAEQMATATKLSEQVTDLTKENSGLHDIVNSPICLVAPSVKFEGVAATFSDRVFLHFTTPSAGKIHIHVERPAAANAFDADSSGTDHYVLVDKLEAAATYAAEAWVVLPSSGAEKQSTRITKNNHDPRMSFKTASGSSTPTFDSFASTPANDTITVSYALNQDVDAEVIVEQELRDSTGTVTYRQVAATTHHIQPDRFGQITTTPVKRGTVETTLFRDLQPNKIYRVTVNAANEYGQIATARTGNLATKDPAAALDFDNAKGIDVSISPVGYLLTWTATTDPDPELQDFGPQDSPKAGLKISFASRPTLGAVVVPAGRKGKVLSAMLDVSSIVQVLANNKQRPPSPELPVEQPILTLYMQKGTTTVTRSVHLTFSLPTSQQIETTGLTAEQKTAATTAATAASQKKTINIDWKKLASTGLSVLLAAAH